MWLLVAREPRPDAPYWRGRRALASLDALVWPLGWAMLIARAPWPVGLVGPLALAFASLLALRRLRCALWTNHRYRFTTWRWAGVASGLILLGAFLRFTVVG